MKDRDFLTYLAPKQVFLLNFQCIVQKNIFNLYKMISDRNSKTIFSNIENNVFNDF